MSAISLRVRFMSGIMGCGIRKEGRERFRGRYFVRDRGKTRRVRISSRLIGRDRWQAAHQRLAMTSPFAASAAKALSGKAISTSNAIAPRRRFCLYDTLPTIVRLRLCHTIAALCSITRSDPSRYRSQRLDEKTLAELMCLKPPGLRGLILG